MSNIEIMISILSGLFFIVSESLPFFKNIKSNGIIHLLYNLIKTNTHNTTNYNLLNAFQRQPLLDTNIDNSFIESLQSNNACCGLETEYTLNQDILISISNNLEKLINTMMEKDIQTSQLKLHTSELYELNYIINYIKINYPKKMYKTKFLNKSNKQLLISQGYIIDYDSQNDNYIIKW